MTPLDHIHIILVETSHPGNIGAAARAMKNMGLSHLRLVQPKEFLCAEAIARAAGADDLLLKAQVFNSLADSITDCSLTIGTTARPRTIAWPTLTPRTCAEKALATPGKVAIVFGRESSGLTNDELELCQFVVTISTDPQFSSLNVAAAVQILAYELRVNSEEETRATDNHLLPPPHHFLEEPATVEAIEQFYQHLEQTLIDIEFLDPQEPKQLMRRLRRLFNRIQLLNSEVNILRGILTAVRKSRR